MRVTMPPALATTSPVRLRSTTSGLGVASRTSTWARVP